MSWVEIFFAITSGICVIIGLVLVVNLIINMKAQIDMFKAIREDKDKGDKDNGNI